MLTRSKTMATIRLGLFCAACLIVSSLRGEPVRLSGELLQVVNSRDFMGFNALMRITAQGNQLLPSSQTDNFVGDYVLLQCQSNADSRLIDAAVLTMRAYVESNWKTDVEAVAAPAANAGGIPVFALTQIRIPLPSGQEDFQLACD